MGSDILWSCQKNSKIPKSRFYDKYSKKKNKFYHWYVNIFQNSISYGNHIIFLANLCHKLAIGRFFINEKKKLKIESNKYQPFFMENQNLLIKYD